MDANAEGQTLLRTEFETDSLSGSLVIRVFPDIAFEDCLLLVRTGGSFPSIRHRPATPAATPRAAAPPDPAHTRSAR